MNILSTSLLLALANIVNAIIMHYRRKFSCIVILVLTVANVLRLTVLKNRSPPVNPPTRAQKRTIKLVESKSTSVQSGPLNDVGKG